MKRNNSFILFGLLWILICKAGFGQDNGLLAYWSFDEVSGPNIVETVKGTKDIIKGNFSFVNGVHGKGIKFDGFTTRITRDSLVNGIWNAPEIKEALTIEAWIAPQAYPWNWNAIVEQKDRYYFGLDATGHIGLRVFIDSYWRKCVSAIQVPFMQWSHIAGTFDPNNGLTVFINGQEVGRFAIAGRFARKRPFEPSEVVDKYFTEHSAAGGAFQIGRNLDNLPAAGTRSIPASYSFDGIIDELKIYGRALDASEIKKSYESLHPSSSPARDCGIERFFYASSACVYNGDKQTDPNNPGLKEADAYPALAEDGYGWEKLFSERMCRHFREDFGLTTRVARFHNVYGPHGTFDGGREKAPAAMCRKVIEASITGKKDISIWGDGHQTRSFMYIDDCVKGILAIMYSDIIEPLNLGSSEMVSINQLVDIVEEIAGFKLNRKYDLDAPKGVRGRNSENTLIKKYLNWEPSIPLNKGMKKTYDWIKDQMSHDSTIKKEANKYNK